MNTIIPVLCSALLFSGSVFAQSAAPVNTNPGAGFRKISLQPGTQFKVEHSMNSSSNMEMMGQSMDIKADMRLFSKVDVTAKNAGTYKLSTTITRMVTSADMMGQAMEYDSDKPGDNETDLGKMLKDKINQPAEADLTEDGRVTLLKKDSSGGGLNPLSSMMGGAEDETNGLGDVFMLIPLEAKAGDSWSDSLINGGTKTYRTYSIKSVSGDEAVITISGTQAINRTVENQGMEVTIELNNKLSGETTVSTTTGLIRQRSLTMEGTGTTGVMGQSIPMTTKVTTQSTLSPL